MAALVFSMDPFRARRRKQFVFDRLAGHKPGVLFLEWLIVACMDQGNPA